jgi:hypothetical protein
LDRRCHFKHVSLKQSRFYHCQMSTARRKRIKVDGSVAIISIKNFPIGLQVMCLYFPDTPLTSIRVNYIPFFAVNATCFGLNDHHQGSQRNSCKLSRPFYDKISKVNLVYNYLRCSTY